MAILWLEWFNFSWGKKGRQFENFKLQIQGLQIELPEGAVVIKS